MSDALDRIVPEDHRGALYRHAAEGVDDMPVRIGEMSRAGWDRLGIWCLLMLLLRVRIRIQGGLLDAISVSWISLLSSVISTSPSTSTSPLPQNK